MQYETLKKLIKLGIIMLVLYVAARDFGPHISSSINKTMDKAGQYKSAYDKANNTELSEKNIAKNIVTNIREIPDNVIDKYVIIDPALDKNNMLGLKPEEQSFWIKLVAGAKERKFKDFLMCGQEFNAEIKIYDQELVHQENVKARLGEGFYKGEFSKYFEFLGLEEIRSITIPRKTLPALYQSKIKSENTNIEIKLHKLDKIYPQEIRYFRLEEQNPGKSIKRAACGSKVVVNVKQILPNKEIIILQKKAIIIGDPKVPIGISQALRNMQEQGVRIAYLNKKLMLGANLQELQEYLSYLQIDNDDDTLILQLEVLNILE